MLSVVSVHGGSSVQSLGLLRSSVQGPSTPLPPPFLEWNTFKLVHYEAQTVRILTARIRLRCLLVRTLSCPWWIVFGPGLYYAHFDNYLIRDLAIVGSVIAR